jgi:hypothetical protein
LMPEKKSMNLSKRLGIDSFDASSIFMPVHSS